jgi:hypothetical protein
MERKKFKKRVEKEGHEYYALHLKIINVFLPEQITDKEAEVLGSFMAIKNELAKNDRFQTIFRKQVMEKLQMKASALTFHIGSLRTKGYIIEDAIGKYQVWSVLWPEEGYQNYEFLLIEKESKDGKE